MKSTVNLAAALQSVATHQAAALTLGDLAHAYDTEGSKATRAPVSARIRRWSEAFGPTSAWAITTEQLSAIAEALRQAGYASASINRDVSAIGSLYRWARKRRYTPTGFISPTISFIRDPEPIRRIAVSEAEIKALRIAAKLDGDRAFEVYVNLLIDSGARKSELLERRWVDVDRPGRRILLETSKTGTGRYLFFTESTAALVNAHYRAGAVFLFEGRHGGPTSFEKRWARAVTNIGRPELRQHDMRHHAAASLLEAGVTAAVAGQVLGHSSQILLRRYGHLESRALQNAQEQRWSAK